MRTLKDFPELKSVKPHGRRYHALMKGPGSLLSFKNKWKDLIEVQEIIPSLEDVFIAAVEGGL
ncbi:hypothetical protein D3C72_2515010 [compost metagenome]